MTLILPLPSRLKSDAIALSKRFASLAKSHQAGVISWLGIPMTNRGQTIGALLLASSENQAFLDLDLALATRVCNQIAGAIDNAALFAGLKEAEAELADSAIERGESARQNEVIAEIGRIISSTLETNNVRDSFAEQVKQLIEFDSLSIGLYDTDSRMATITFTSGIKIEGRESGTGVSPAGTLTEIISKTLAPMIVQGLTEQDLAKRFPFLVKNYDTGMRSWLGCPMVNRGEFVGAIIFQSRKENAFRERDAQLALRVGNQIAGSIDGARLYAELKKAETDLAASNERNQLILETAHDAFISIDDRGQVVTWNSQAEKTFGWAVGEAVRRRLSDLIIPARFADRHLEGIKEFIATGKGLVLNQRIEMVARHHDGHEFPVEITIAPLKLGDRYLFNAFIRDITERREAETALGRSEEKFRAVYNNAANGIGTRNVDGSVIDLNPSFLRMVDYTLDEIKRLEPGVLFDSSYIEFEKALWDRALQGEEMPPYEKEYFRKDGTIVYAEVRTSLERDDDGNPIGIVEVTTDITVRKRLEQEIAKHTETLEIANLELQQLDRMKDEFISTVSHELRTPLTVDASDERFLSWKHEGPTLTKPPAD